MTAFLSELRMELKRLEEIYLPSAPHVLPTPEDQERARAFVIFCHAEIEWYIERAAKSYLKFVCDEAKKGVFNFSSLALIAFSDARFPVGESLGGKKDGKNIATIFGKIQVDLESTVDRNNGIREKNISKFLGPLGFSGRIDAAWLGDLDSLASLRGRFAHMSGGGGATTIASINPEDIRKLCRRIVEGDGVVGRSLIASIREMDDTFEKCKSEFSSVVLVRTLKSLFKIFEYFNR